MANTLHFEDSLQPAAGSFNNYTRLYLVRHGHLINSHTGVYNGHSDVELSPEGISQTIAIAERFKDKSVSAVYSSDLRRSRDGAEIIAGYHGLEVVPVHAFREMNFGHWEGLTPDGIQSRYTDIWMNWIRGPVYTRPPGGETLLEVHARVITELNNLIIRHVNEEVILVSHAGVNRIILCHALNLAIENLFRIEQDFCCTNIIDFYDSFAVVRLINGGH